MAFIHHRDDCCIVSSFSEYIPVIRGLVCLFPMQPNHGAAYVACIVWLEQSHEWFLTLHLLLYEMLYCNGDSFVAILFCFILGTTRTSYNFPTPCVPVAPGSDGPRPMAIFELLDFIVNEVCYVRDLQKS